MTAATILVVDDDAFFRTYCSEVLQGEGHRVLAAASGREALELLDRTQPGLIVADIYMPEMTGLELLETIKARHPALDVIIMTGYASIDTAVQALKRGAADYLRKPFAAEELTAVVHATLDQRRLYQENKRLQQQLELHEMTRSFSAVEDPPRVLELALGTLSAACRSNAALYLHNADPLNYMALLHHTGLEKTQAHAVRDALVARGLKQLRRVDTATVLPRGRLGKVLGSQLQPDVEEALFVPMRPMGASEGMFVLFRSAREQHYQDSDLDKARFLQHQIEHSYLTAKRFQDARQLAYIDSLTDLYNARYMDQALEESIQHAKETGGTFSMLFLDLDNFKEVNDAFGHITGGKTLIEISRILRACVRDEDTVFRYGGDEFTVLLPATDPPLAREVAERIRQAIRGHTFLGREGHDIRLTASIGVATYPYDAGNREELVERADQAMYRNKEATRDAVYTARPQ